MFFLESVCSACEVVKVLSFIKKMMNVLSILIPIFLIVFLTVDFFKNVVTNSEEERKKNVNLAIKRIIAAICVFLVPTFVGIAMNALENAGVKGAINYNLATDEILKSDLFKDWEKSGNIDYSAVINFGGGRKKVTSSSAQTSLTSQNGEFKTKKDLIVLAQIKASHNGKSNDYIRSETIKIYDKNNKELPASNFTFKSESPGIAKVNSAGKVTANFGGTTNIVVTSKKDNKQSLKVKVTIAHSLYTKVRTRKKLTVTDLATGKTVTLSKGTKGVINGLGEKITSCTYKHYIEGNTLRVGKSYYKVNVEDVKRYDYYIDDKMDQKTVEEFVNARGFKSKRKYLFWSNQGTQYEYIFKGSKGNWKLYKVFPISSGDVIGHSVCSGTGIHPKYYKMGGVIYRAFGGGSYPDGYIPRNGYSSGYHARGGTRRPKTRGCTAFKKKHLKWFTSNIEEIKEAQIVTI